MAHPDLHRQAERELDDARDRFADAFGPGGQLSFVRSPGRVNLIGEHTDYNDGFVCPMAIGPHVLFAFRRRDDSMLRVRSAQFPGAGAEIDLAGDIGRGEPAWANYLRGPAALLKERGVALVGLDVLISNTLPVGGGLSSSAAMEVGIATALLHAAGAPPIDPDAMALMCQRAEHEWAGVPCGIMDQSIVAGGRAGHAMLLDCRSGAKRFVPVPPADVSVVVVNSMVRHELTGGEYAERRRQCGEAVEYFRERRPGVTALRDVTADQLADAEGDLPEAIFRRARHVVGENGRAVRFADLLAAGDHAAAGELMIDSHISLSDDYQVSTPELDFLAFEATKIDGCHGARMTGGGFGGCTVSLVRPGAAAEFVDRLQAAFRERYDVTPDAFVTAATDGAAVL